MNVSSVSPATNRSKYQCIKRMMGRTQKKSHGFRILKRTLFLCVLTSAVVPFLLDTPDQVSGLMKGSKDMMHYDKNRAKGLRKTIVAPAVKEASPSTTKNRFKLRWQNHTLHQAPKDAWYNDRRIVHVIYTRFMQHQPDLVALGLARLELFVTFCLPTIIQQTNQQFLWIIRTDPDLHTTLRESLVEELSGLPNVVVVGSNEIKKGSLDGGFRDDDSIDDITPESLFCGNLELVQSFHRNAKNRSVLETNLDADDGLGLNFVDTIQNMTYHRFLGKKRKTAWFNICTGRHLEWQYYSPWDNTTKKGSLTLGSTHICVTAGLSWASMTRADPDFAEAHHLIKQETHDCKTFHRNHLGCWEELPDAEFMAIRARTPTSTGMARVLTTESTWTTEQAEEEKSHWALLESSFGILQSTVEKSRQYVTDHMQTIVEDNLKGQCKTDHSCSEGIKKKLKKILFDGNMWKNKHDLVHVIQTSLDSSLSIHILNQFSFASLEAQTSYEFLWIIRLKELPEYEEEEMEEFLTSKIVGKSPLNILVVKSDQTSTLDFRNEQAIRDITEDTLLYGDTGLLEDFHQAAQNRTLLETFLEPYDALSKTFVEEMQRTTVSQLEESQVLEDGNSWYYRCNSQYVAWNYFTPEGYDADSGFLGIAGLEGVDCVENPGVTRISLPKAQIPYFDESNQTPECQVLVVLRIQNGCYSPVFSNETLTARATIPESVEMPVPRQVASGDLEQLDEEDKHLRSVLRDAFNIFPSAVESMRSYIQKTQCHDSRTCNPKWDSEHGVTHVVQTSVQSESEFLKWRYFCLSLESQTTKKFLWIIRVPPGSTFTENLIKTINGISLNVIVARSFSSPAGSFRHPSAVAELRNETLVYGDGTMLEYFHQSSQRRPLLETFLGPSESLSKRFISDAQKALALEVKEKSAVHGQAEWYYRCASSVVEWIPWGGKLDGTFVRTAIPEKCANSPGITRISLPGTDIPVSTTASALDQRCADTGGSHPNGCYTVFPSKFKTARVSTSDSHFDPRSTNMLEEQKQWYESLKADFGIFRMSLVQLISRMNEEEKAVAPVGWQNGRNIVHVIHSRVLQQQGTLLELGVARMKLFQTICVPTIAAQTNKQFLWVVRTDPELLPELKERLLKTMVNLANVVIVSSDIGVDGHHDGSFRSDTALDEFNEASMLLGDFSLVRSYHQASKEHVLVETNLDSDDGIAVNFVDRVQAKVSALFEADHGKIGWVQLCIGDHLEWHFYSPWEKRSDKGCLLQGKTRSCIKSGMSWATQPKSNPAFMTALHNLKEYLPSCSFNRTAETLLFEGCWDEAELEDPENDVMALRVMSPASAGVARGEISKFDWSIQSLLFDKIAWTLLDPYFSVRMERIKTARKHLDDNLSVVTADNERSKCTHEKTCAGKWKNTNRVVHVIHTELRDPNLADMLHRVSLSSLTRQTSYEFLWIIRVADFTDHRLLLSMLGPLKKSSFADNIILVKSEAAPAINFRLVDPSIDVAQERVLHGDTGVLYDYHEASQTRPLLETFLRPSEGLIRTFVEELQSATVEHYEKMTTAHQKNGWYYRCLSEYMERSYFVPNGTVANNGFLRVIQTRGQGCMGAPGVTRISLPNSTVTTSFAPENSKKCKGRVADFGSGCFTEVESAKTPALRILLPKKDKMQPQMVNENIQDTLAQQRRFSLQLRLLYSVFPPTFEEMEMTVKENDRQIVHIIHTSLRSPAEIKTWRHFCVETIVQQTNQNFFWIIRADFADSTFIKEISNPLKYNYEKPRNVMLVRSNYTPTVDFRSNDAIADITEKNVVRGLKEELDSMHMASQGRTVLETFLQPTENLAKTFIDEIQRTVQLKTRDEKMLGIRITKDHGKQQDKAWYFYCVPRFIEWTYSGPLGKKLKRGFLRRTHLNESSCTQNPALTRVSFPGSGGQVVSSVSKLEACSLEQGNGCYSALNDHNPLVSRAVIPNSEQDKPKLSKMTGKEITSLEAQNIELSTLLGEEFSVFPYPLETMTTQMEKLYCGDVDTCYSQYDSEFGVVHIIQTSLQDPEMFDVWRRFCFSLESQTTNKFLWILRVGADEGLIREVRKPIRKTPLHIIVARSNRSSITPFRHADALLDLTNGTIVDGDKKLLQYYHESAQTRPLLETFLDPTDALDKSFVQRVQSTTAEQLKTFNLTDDDWFYQCIPNYIEWTPDSLQEDSERGWLEVAESDKKSCSNLPGTTRVSLSKVMMAEGELGEHHFCTPPTDIQGGCVLPIKANEPLAARALVPGGTMPIPFKKSYDSEAKEIQDRLARKMKDDFGISPMFLKQMREKLKARMKGTKRESLQK